MDWTGSGADGYFSDLCLLPGQMAVLLTHVATQGSVQSSREGCGEARSGGPGTLPGGAGSGCLGHTHVEGMRGTATWRLLVSNKGRASGDLCWCLDSRGSRKGQR